MSTPLVLKEALVSWERKLMYSQHPNNCCRWDGICLCIYMKKEFVYTCIIGCAIILYACLLKVYELTLHYTQHWDHNVVTAALELLQQVFRTPPPELLHMLITAGSIPHATVFRQDTENRSRSGSILEFIGNHMNWLILSKQCFLLSL